jgi:hypothetical protein
VGMTLLRGKMLCSTTYTMRDAASSGIRRKVRP